MLHSSANMAHDCVLKLLMLLGSVLKLPIPLAKPVVDDELSLSAEFIWRFGRANLQVSTNLSAGC